MKVIFYSLLILLGCFSMAHAERCSGKWGGQANTSVTFSGGKKVRYCYKSECWDVQFAGSKDSRLKFTFGRGAVVSLTKADKGYSATWQLGARKASAKLSCK